MPKQPSAVPQSPEQARLALDAELVQVTGEIQAALSDLFAPFSQMIETRLRALGPMTRAAVVLTAGVGAPDTQELRSKRVYLAAALEMLHLALAVHMALGETAGADTTQYQSLLGSTILAGDYCFSRSAGLAVRTGDPIVVEIFSDALKRVSEGNLRHFFEPTDRQFDEDRELFLAGIAASGQLVGSPAAVQMVQRQMVDRLATAQLRTDQTPPAPDEAALVGFSPLQQARWRALFDWYTGH